MGAPKNKKRNQAPSRKVRRGLVMMMMMTMMMMVNVEVQGCHNTKMMQAGQSRWNSDANFNFKPREPQGGR